MPTVNSGDEPRRKPTDGSGMSRNGKRLDAESVGAYWETTLIDSIAARGIARSRSTAGAGDRHRGEETTYRHPRRVKGND
jgi:hypothetical protein